MTKKSPESESFGAKLRKLREKENIGIEDLAAQINMKPEYLRGIEENKIIPPVGEILTLARSLSVEPSTFMESGSGGGASSIKRRTAISKRTNDYAYENLTADEPDKHLMAFKVTIDPKSEHRKVGYSHEGEEFIYALSGKLKITIGGKSHILKPGEHIHFDSGKKHLLNNPGEEKTVLLVVIYAK